MNKEKPSAFLAIDIGASSGRAIVGSIKNSKLELKEINRFTNPIIEVNGKQFWNLFHLYDEIVSSIKIAKQNDMQITSIGIDTWGVDYVCFGKDGEPLKMPYCYRDLQNDGAPERFFNKISKEEVYDKTGIQIMNFNTLFQLDTQKENNSSIYPIIDKILFMPDALSYLLTEKMVTEYSIASTSQMINPYDRSFDESLLEAIGLTKENFAPMVLSGSKIGTLSQSVKDMTGCDEMDVIAVAGHDTASAVLATPAENDNFAYLSSGTWSLMGVEVDEPIINEASYELNFTNEGGADGSIRLLKNICGMWLIEQCKQEWERSKEISYDEIVESAMQAKPFVSFINPDAPIFANPRSMVEAIQTYCKKTDQPVPETMGEISRCIYESLSFRYRQVLNDLQELSGKTIEKLHIIGGGSKNNMLNQFTANAINMTVVAGPSEATAIGNVLMQAKAAGLVNSKAEMRELVRNSTELDQFIPQNSDEWNKMYNKYLETYITI